MNPHVTNDTLSIDSFERAIQRLEEGIARHLSNINDDQIRDGLIQRFDFTYELGHRTLKRYLKFAAANPEEIDEMTFQDVIRTANGQGLIRGNWEDWREFREMRSRTSHTYDEETALEVTVGIPRFIEEVSYLRDQLRRRIG